MTSVTTDLDPAVVVAAHHELNPGMVCAVCVEDSGGDHDPPVGVDWPCLSYRLAEAMVASEARFARLKEQTLYLAGQYGRLLAAHEQVEMDTPEDRALHARLVAEFRYALPGLSAALADEPDA